MTRLDRALCLIRANEILEGLKYAVETITGIDEAKRQGIISLSRGGDSASTASPGEEPSGSPRHRRTADAHDRNWFLMIIITHAEPADIDALASIAEEMDRFYGGTETDPPEAVGGYNGTGNLVGPLAARAAVGRVVDSRPAPTWCAS
jgi:hypothetical protein